VANPQIRLRQRGETYFLTKKYPKDGVDLSVMIEETISLSEAEYAYFRKNVPGNYLAKTRYKKESNGIIIEVDAYQDALSPLILVDFEWTDHMPGDELLAQFKITQNVTQINELAGGQLAGKTYEQIAKFIAN
jgi:CYTH domain-containing protein